MEARATDWMRSEGRDAILVDHEWNFLDRDETILRLNRDHPEDIERDRHSHLYRQPRREDDVAAHAIDGDFNNDGGASDQDEGSDQEEGPDQEEGSDERSSNNSSSSGNSDDGDSSSSGNDGSDNDDSGDERQAHLDLERRAHED